MRTKFLLDSGDPNEYQTAQILAKSKGLEIWGATTNPSLIAKKLSGKKVTFNEAFSVLQREIVKEILKIVPGIVSAEVYSDLKTTADEMIKQGFEIAAWDTRIAVKLPTTFEGFKARTKLREKGILINNTLVFSQEQSFAILLHEKIMLEKYGKPKNNFPCFISPFVGRLDDTGLNGMSFIANIIKTQNNFFSKNTGWMLEASVRNLTHLKNGINLDCDLITAPLKIYQEYFQAKNQTTNNQMVKQLNQIPYWEPPDYLLKIKTLDDFFNALELNKLNIFHNLTNQGIEKFVADWQLIIS